MNAMLLVEKTFLLSKYCVQHNIMSPACIILFQIKLAGPIYSRFQIVCIIRSFNYVLTCYNIIIEQTICVAATGVLSLHSSLERSGNREFGCPQETVALTCSVNGTFLGWDHTNGSSLGTFTNETGFVGKGFFEKVDCDEGAGIVIASGVLELFKPERDSNFTIFNSTMTLTPSPDCARISLNVTCKSEGSGPKNSTIFKIAGESSCIHHYYTE